MSEALDAETLWVQSIRPLARPKTGDVEDGAVIFAGECSPCHGGAKWTKSQTIYLNNPTLDRDPAAGGTPIDPNLDAAGAQIRSFTNATAGTLFFLDDVGTFDPADPLEIKNDGKTSLGAFGFNTPSLLGIGHTAPYFHDGSAATLDDVFTKHVLPGAVRPTIASLHNDTQLGALRDFLLAIDGTTTIFPSDTDAFLDSLTP